AGALLEKRPQAPLKGLFVSGGFIFALAAMIHEVPYDARMYFDQEEVSYSLLLFTPGWIVYHSTKPVVYYHYAEHASPSKHLHWQDLMDAGFKDKAYQLLDRGLKRFNQLTGYSSQATPL